jgi:hypothetical protein
MFLLRVIEYYYPIHENIKNTIQTNFNYLQNIYCLGIVSYATVTMLSSNIELQQTAINIVKWQCILEILLCRPDVILHHIAVLCILYPVTNNFDVITHFIPEMITVLQTEISSIFLSLRGIIPTKYTRFHIINNLCFLFTFVYTRLYQYINYIIYNESMYNNIILYYTPSNATILVIGLHSLFYVNIYWGAIIIKTIIKPFQMSDFMPTFYQCEHIIKYTYFLSSTVCFYIYYPLENAWCYMDILGVSILSISSYYYHNMTTYFAIDKNSLDDDFVWYYIKDIVCIHLRCFLCIVTNTNIYIRSLSDVFNMKMMLLYTSFIIHYVGIDQFIKYIKVLKDSNESMPLHKGVPPKFMRIQLFQGIPVIIDSLIIAYSSNHIYARNNIFLITAIIIINLLVGPLYQMNHLMFHILLLCQTFFLCQMNKIVTDVSLH